MYDLATTALPVGNVTRVRALGGTTNVWWGGSALLEEIDVAPRPWLGVPGWPLGRDELLPFYARGCRILGIPDLTEVRTDRFRDGKGFLVQTEDLGVATLYWPRRALRFSDALGRAARLDRGLDPYLFAHVTRLVPTADRGAVESVEVRTLAGGTFTVRPGVVVLACGGIENARLLLASAADAGGGFGNDRDVVGRYYMDHPKGVLGRITLDPARATLLHPGYWDSRPGRFRLGIRLSPTRQEDEGLLDAYLRFHPVLTTEGSGTEALRALRRHPASAVRSRAVMRDLVAGMPDLARFARFKITNRGSVGSAEIHNFLEQAPRPENRVTLSDRVDRFGTPLPQLTWSIDERERQTIRRLHALLDVDLRRRGFGAVDGPLISGDDEPWGIDGDASHHMGTTRMGDDPSTSVVDRTCRVHGLTNLYVAGSSVFPTAGYANPTLTIVALALRLADHLAD